jgi:hypothetical protein
MREAATALHQTAVTGGATNGTSSANYRSNSANYQSRSQPRPVPRSWLSLMAQSDIRTVGMPAADTRESDDRDVSCVA